MQCCFPLIDPQTMILMDQFRANTLSSREEMLRLLARGEKNARLLFQGNLPPNLEKKDAAALMWYFMAQAAKRGELFDKGVLRFCDQDAAKITAFLIACGGGETYQRISTHFKGQIEGPQYAIDFQDVEGILPCHLGTMLFGNLKDGSCFIKMERRGCPVPLIVKYLFTNPFKSLEKIIECIGHLWDFIQTRFEKETGVYPGRRDTENYTTLKKAYKKLMLETDDESTNFFFRLFKHIEVKIPRTIQKMELNVRRRYTPKMEKSKSYLKFRELLAAQKIIAKEEEALHQRRFGNEVMLYLHKR